MRHPTSHASRLSLPFNTHRTAWSRIVPASQSSNHRFFAGYRGGATAYDMPWSWRRAQELARQEDEEAAYWEHVQCTRERSNDADAAAREVLAARYAHQQDLASLTGEYSDAPLVLCDIVNARASMLSDIQRDQVQSFANELGYQSALGFKVDPDALLILSRMNEALESAAESQTTHGVETDQHVAGHLKRSAWSEGEDLAYETYCFLLGGPEDDSVD